MPLMVKATSRAAVARYRPCSSSSRDGERPGYAVFGRFLVGRGEVV